MKNIIVLILMSIFALTACLSDRQQGINSLQTDVKVFRYDRLQYEAVALNSFSAMQKMSLDCPQATKILIEEVLGLGRVNEPVINERLCAYYSDSVLLKLMEDAESKFKDMTWIEEGLTDGFRNLVREVPEIPVPRIYAQISALNQSVVVGDSLVGFSLDKYMGEDYPLYQKYYYAYQRRSMNPERILPDCFTFYLMSYYPFHWMPNHRSLFDIIMHQGKINWVVKHILKLKSDAAVLGYTEDESRWCKKNRKKIWEWMKSQGHLSSTDPMVIWAYTHPDPSAVFNGEKIPPVIGVWMGMQLVQKYMDEHPDLSIKELLETQYFDDLSLN